MGEHAEARRQIELALESDLRQFGPDHPNVAVRRSNLANILGDLGEHGEARRQIELALESDLRQFGPDHPDVAAHRSNLANILRALGEHGEARRQIELALESDLRQFGPDHPTVCRALFEPIHPSCANWVSMPKRAGRSSWRWSRICGSSGSGSSHRRGRAPFEILANILRALWAKACRSARGQIELAPELALQAAFGVGPSQRGLAPFESSCHPGALGEAAEARRQIEMALESELRSGRAGTHPTTIGESRRATLRLSFTVWESAKPLCGRSSWRWRYSGGNCRRGTLDIGQC